MATNEDLAREAAKPQSVTIPGLSVTRRSLSDQIAMDRYLAKKKAAKKRLGGIRLIRTSPPSMG